jgi:hypothetical protein
MLLLARHRRSRDLHGATTLSAAQEPRQLETPPDGVFASANVHFGSTAPVRRLVLIGASRPCPAVRPAGSKSAEAVIALARRKAAPARLAALSADSTSPYAPSHVVLAFAAAFLGAAFRSFSRTSGETRPSRPPYSCSGSKVSILAASCRRALQLLAKPSSTVPGIVILTTAMNSSIAAPGSSRAGLLVDRNPPPARQATTEDRRYNNPIPPTWKHLE